VGEQVRELGALLYEIELRQCRDALAKARDASISLSTMPESLKLNV